MGVSSFCDLDTSQLVCGSSSGSGSDVGVEQTIQCQQRTKKILNEIPSERELIRGQTTGRKNVSLPKSRYQPRYS